MEILGILFIVFAAGSLLAVGGDGSLLYPNPYAKDCTCTYGVRIEKGIGARGGYRCCNCGRCVSDE